MQQAGSDPTSARLDSFIDAAFAFAITLVIVASESPPDDFSELRQAMKALPAYAISFTFIAMFWHAHLRWRRLVRTATPLSVFLSLLLIFLVLVYVFPLRLVAQLLADYAAGAGPAIPDRERAGLFAVYGFGFATMAATQAALFASSLRRPELTGEQRMALRSETWIGGILAACGGLSVLLSLFPGTSGLAPWAYPLIPIGIGALMIHDRRSSGRRTRRSSSD
ncbi:MAG TPA: TMEM175 family protein [Allosphingosinicella sp.]|jgi:hypothetical protein